jgi:SNF2 family DNA or RNA helicase
MLSRQTNGLLADDMGLGKTVEAILIDKVKRGKLEFPNRAKTLVIAPLSVIDVWVRHFAEWNPSLIVSAIDPKNRGAMLKKPAHVYIVHWDALRLMPQLNKHLWFHVIADEAHHAKNRKAQMTQALKRIHAENKLASTGTPADDKPHDIWSILNWLYPKKFTSYWRFYNDHVEWDTHPKGGYRIIKGVRNVQKLHEDIRPFYVRRQKEEVLTDLPDKTYSEIHVTLQAQQRRAYEQMKKDMLAWVGENEDKPVAAPVAIARLMRLQQFALTHMDVEEGWKQVRMPEGRLKWLLEHNQTPHAHPDGRLPREGFEYAPGVIYKMVEPSSKLDVVMQLIEDNPHESFVVFSQFKQVANLLSRRLTAAKISYGCYTGDTTKVDRDRIVDEFQAGKRKVFVGTIRSGGEGITLTRARTMLFTDRDWSPTKNRQAEDRIHRIGQKNAVQIVDIVANDTVDRGRLQAIDLKWTFIKQLLGEA